MIDVELPEKVTAPVPKAIVAELLVVPLIDERVPD